MDRLLLTIHRITNLSAPLFGQQLSLVVESDIVSAYPPTEKKALTLMTATVDVPADAHGSEALDMESCLARFEVNYTPFQPPHHTLTTFRLSVYLLVPQKSLSRMQAQGSHKTSASQPPTAVLLTSVVFTAELYAVVHIDKIRGFLLSSSVADFAVTLEVDPNDREGFARRLREFFTSENPERVHNIPVIVSDDFGADEIAVYSKMHSKYDALSSWRGSLNERVLDMFELYDLGAPRAAVALMEAWRGRELELLASLVCENGPECFDISRSTRLAAYCSFKGIPERVYLELLSKAAALDDAAWRRMLAELTAGYGPEPSPTLYLRAPRVADDDLTAVFSGVLERSAQQAHTPTFGNDVAAVFPTASVNGIRDYLRVQFGRSPTADAYRHLSADEQNVSVLRQLQSASTGWPLHRGSFDVAKLQAQSSFRYNPAAQSLVTGKHSTDVATTRAPTVSAVEQQQAAAHRIAKSALVHHESIASAATSIVPHRGSPHRAKIESSTATQHRLATHQSVIDAKMVEQIRELVPVRVLDVAVQVNPFADLHGDHREAFCSLDPYSPEYAWLRLVDALETCTAEQRSNGSHSSWPTYNQLFYLTPKELQQVAHRLSKVVDLPDSVEHGVLARHESSAIRECRVVHVTDTSSADYKFLMNAVYSAAAGTLKHIQLLSVDRVLSVTHTIHDAVFHQLSAADPTRVLRCLVVRQSKPTELWENIAFRVSQDSAPHVPYQLRAYRNFWTAARAANKAERDHSGTGARSSGSLVSLRHRSLDIFLCDVWLGERVFTTPSADVPFDCPVQYDCVAVNVGHETDECIVVYNREHVRVVGVASGCVVDPDAAGCQRHPDQRSLFAAGQASSLLNLDVRSTLSAALLLELQATKGMCLACLAERAFVERRNVSLPPPSNSGRDHVTSVSSPLHSVHPSASGAALVEEAWELWSNGKHDACRRALERAAQDSDTSSSSAEAEGLLAELFDRHYSNAVVHYREALRRDGLNLSAYHRLANVLEVRFNENEEALKLFGEAAARGHVASAKRAEMLTQSASTSAITEPASSTSKARPRVASLRPPVTSGTPGAPSTPLQYTFGHTQPLSKSSRLL